MDKEKLRRNFIVPLGEFRSPPMGEVDPAWVLIHEERVKHGISNVDLSAILGRSVDTLVSKGERGGPASLKFTREVLALFGYQLVIAPLEQPDDV
jgi:hypothetical protein